MERWSAEDGGSAASPMSPGPKEVLVLLGDPTYVITAPDGRAPRLACRAPEQDSPPGTSGAVTEFQSSPAIVLTQNNISYYNTQNCKAHAG